ncbi:MAG: hypothetical protein ACRYGH_12935 [Janthinobacterium lividum]
MLPDRYRRLLVGSFFGVLLVLGLVLVRDYGSSCDEAVGRDSGQINVAYLYEFVPAALLPARAAARLAHTPSAARLPNYVDRDYGVAYELPLAILEKISGYQDHQDLGKILLLRHTCTFLVCFAGLMAFYWLATQRLGSWRLGLLAAGLLVLSPRQFADSFYNFKDSVFLACFLLATATAVAFIRRPTLAHAAWHALACAVALDVRLMALLLPVLTVGLVLLRRLRGEYPRPQQVVPAILLYVSLVAVLLIAIWPYLWAAPWTNFVHAFRNMSHFRWTFSILHQGRILPGGAPLPWSYALVWIGITTPLLYLAGLAVSTGLLAKQLVRRGWRLFATDAEWQDLLLWALAAGPLAAVIVLHSVLYDGWRQLYFVYPPLLLLALQGLVAAWRWRWPWPAAQVGWRVGLASGVVSALVLLAGQMVALHPLQNLYFNALAGSHPELRYEYDYWGLSLRQGLAWIAGHDARPRIRVATNQQTTDRLSLSLLPPADRARLVIVLTPAQADYFMTTYRYHPQPYPFGPPAYSLRVEAEGRRVLDIFRLH